MVKRSIFPEKRVPILEEIMVNQKLMTMGRFTADDR